MCYVVRSCNILAHLRCTRHRLPGTRVATLELQAPSAAVGPLKQLERVVGVGVEGEGGRVCKSGLQKFSVARLLRFFRSRTLSIGICTMKTLEFPFLFCVFSFLFLIVVVVVETCRVSKGDTGPAANWGWSELFGSRTMVQELLAKQKAF